MAFDPFFYGATYMQNYQGTLSPIEHFVQIGAARGNKPNALFDPVWYKNAFADVRNTNFDGADLLIHFLRFGLDEGRAPSAPFAGFNATSYLAANPDVAAFVNANLATFGGSAANGALAHFVKFGQFEGRTGSGVVGAVATGQSFTLTVGEDSGAAFTGGGGNDTFTAPVVQDNAGNAVDTLESVDILDGGAGTDTLNVTLSNSAPGDVAPILRSIEVVNVRFAAGETLDLSNSTGVTNVGVGSSASAGTISNLGTIANLAVRNQNQDAFFQNSKATSLNVTVESVGKTTAFNDVDVTGGLATALNLTVNNANADVLGLGNVTALTIAAQGASAIGLADSAASIETITVTGAGTVNLSKADIGGGVANVDFTALETLTATGNTGGVTIRVDDTATTINTGAGKDSITYVGAAVAATAKVDLGAGNDTFVIAAATTKGAVINAGDGTDTLKVINGAHLDANAEDIYSSFETLAIGGGQGLYDLANLPGITAVTVSAALADAANIDNAAAGTTVTVTASKADVDTTKALTYALETATGKTDAVSLTLSGTEDTTADGDADGEIIVNSFTANGIETFNLVSSIAGFEIEAGSGIKVSDYLHEITALQGNAVQTINISGNANLTVVDLTAAALTKVNASTATGEIVINVSKADQSVEFLGGSADDTYTGTAFGDTINAGAGADDITLDGIATEVDTLIFEAGDSVLNVDTDGHDVITNFGTGASLDIIDLGAFNFSGTKSSALANKGALANTVINGTVLTQADFFNSGGVDRAVAIGTNSGNTYVFVDVNNDGDFTAAADLFIELNGVTNVTLANFGF